MSPQRLQKALARAGLGSRRKIETWIRDGKITINGRPAALGDQVNQKDVIVVNGRRVHWPAHSPLRVIAYHKPVGQVCTRQDPEGRPTIFNALPRLKTGRWIQVGRLDINTSGLLLLTNDGDLANCLMHPSAGIEREYAVRVLGDVNDNMIKRLLQGVMLEDGPAAFSHISQRGGGGANRWFHVVLKEGRKNEVRRLWTSQGVTVNRLIRIRFGIIRLEKTLHPGQWRDLTPSQMNALCAAASYQTRR